MHKNLIFGGSMFVVGICSFIYSSWGILFFVKSEEKIQTQHAAEYMPPQTIKEVQHSYTFEQAKEAYAQMRYAHTAQLIEQKSEKLTEEEAILLANAQQKMGESENAIRTLEKNMTTPASLAMQNAWIRITLENGDISKAKTILNEFSDHDGKTFFGTIIALAENNGEEAKKLIATVSENSAFAQEKIIIQNIFKTYESFSDGSPHFLSAMSANALKDFGFAKLSLPMLKNILEESPDYRDAWIVMGSAYISLKQFDVAQSMLEKAISLDPTHPQSPYLLGFCLAELSMYDDALIQFDTAIKNGYEPKTKILRAKADVFLRKNDYTNALANYEAIIASGNALGSDFTKAITLSLSELNIPEKAKELANAAAQKFPEDISLSAQKAFVESNAEMLKNLSAQHPNNAEIVLYLGKIALQKTNTEEAKQYFKACYEKGNGNAFASECATRYNAL